MEVVEDRAQAVGVEVTVHHREGDVAEVPGGESGDGWVEDCDLAGEVVGPGFEVALVGVAPVLFIDAVEAPFEALAAPLVEACAADGVIAEALEGDVEVPGLESDLPYGLGERVPGDEDWPLLQLSEKGGGIREEEEVGVEGDHGIEAAGVQEVKGQAGAEREAVFATAAVATCFREFRVGGFERADGDGTEAGFAQLRKPRVGNVVEAKGEDLGGRRWHLAAEGPDQGQAAGEVSAVEQRAERDVHRMAGSRTNPAHSKRWPPIQPGSSQVLTEVPAMRKQEAISLVRRSCEKNQKGDSMR